MHCFTPHSLTSEGVHATAMLTSNLLQLPLLREFPAQRTQVRNAVLTRLQYRIFRADTAIGRNPQVECRKERVRHSIRRELDELVLVKALRD